MIYDTEKIDETSTVISEEDDASIFTTTDDNATKKKKKIRRCLLWSVCILLLVLLALVLDLVLAPVKEANVDSIVLDVRNFQPVAEIEFALDYGSLFSIVEVQDMRCSLDSGSVEFDITKLDRDDEDDDSDDSGSGSDRYSVQVSCPEEDVESHASLLWDILTRKDNTDTLQSLMENGSCEMIVHVRLGHIIPITHSIELPLEKLMEMGPDNKDQDDDDDEQESSNGPTLPANVCNIDKESLDICIPLNLSESSKSRLPSVVQLKLPALKIYAQPTYTTGMVISMDAWDAIFDPDSTDDDDGEDTTGNTAMISISSRDDHLPFYRPLIDLFLNGVDATTIAITVDGEGSFLEILLGRRHEINIQNYDGSNNQGNDNGRTGGGGGGGENNDDQRQLASVPAGFYNAYSDAAEHCMRINDNSEALEFGLCWLLDIPQDRVTLVGNMTVYDKSMSMYSETSWTTETKYAKIDMGAAVFVVGEDDLMDIIGELVFDIRDTSDIDIDLALKNEGSLWPFTAKLLTTGSTEDIVLDMTLDDVTFVWDGEGVDGANGEITFDWGDAFADNFVMTASLSHAEADTMEAKLEMDNTGDQDFVMNGESHCNWDGEDIWDATLSVVTDAEGMDFSEDEFTIAELIDYGHMTAIGKDVISGGELSLTGALKREQPQGCNGACDDDLTVTGALVHAQETGGTVMTKNAMSMRLELLYNEAKNFVMKQSTNFTLSSEDIWQTAMTFSLDSDESANKGYMAMEFTEKLSDFVISLSSEMESVPEEGCDDYDYDYDGSDYSYSYRDSNNCQGDFLLKTDIVHGGVDTIDTISIENNIFFSQEQDFVFETLSTCFWGGEDIYDATISFFFNKEYDDYVYYNVDTSSSMGLSAEEVLSEFTMSWDTNTSRLVDEDDAFYLVTTIVFDEDEDVINLEVEILFGGHEATEPRETFLLQASSTGMWDLENIWDANMSISWDGDDPYYPVPDNISGDLDVTIEEILSGFTWSTVARVVEVPDTVTMVDAFLVNTVTIYLDTFLIKAEEQVYADSTGQFKIDIPAKSVTLGLDDNGKMDFVADLEFTWFSIGGKVDKFIIRRDGEGTSTIFLDGTAIFEAAAEETSFVFDFQMPERKRRLDSDIRYILDDSAKTFALQVTRIHHQSEEENKSFVDFTSRMVLGYEDLSFELSAKETAEMDFDANFTCRISEEESSTKDSVELNIDKLFLKSGSETFIDMNMSMGIDIFENEDLEMDLLSITTDESHLQMNMLMNMTWFENDEALRMVMDHAVFGWKETMYLEMPMQVTDPVIIVSGPSSPSSPSADSTDDGDVETYKFKGIKLRMEGMPALTASSRVAFQDATVAFYEGFYKPGTSRRRLEVDVSSLRSFETTVTVTSDDPDETGNTITYDQSVTFADGANTTTASSDALDLLITPFEDDANEQAYLTQLSERDDDFANVTEVGTPVPDETDTGTQEPKEDPEKKDDDGLSVGAIVGIAVGALVGVCCCCVAAGLLRKKKESQSDNGLPMHKNVNGFEDEALIGECRAVTPSQQTPEDSEEYEDSDEEDSDEDDDDEDSSEDESESEDDDEEEEEDSDEEDKDSDEDESESEEDDDDDWEDEDSSEEA